MSLPVFSVETLTDAVLGGEDAQVLLNVLSEDIYGSIPPNIPITSSVSRFVKYLQIGDIINRRTFIPGTHVVFPFSRFLSILQHEYFPHSSLYVGSGKVFNMTSTGSRLVPTERYVRGGVCLLIKPKASQRQRVEAVKYVLDNFLGESTSYRTFVAAVASRVYRRITGRKFRHRVGGLICSSVIAKAYKGIKFTKGHIADYVAPVDFVRSNLTKKVIIYAPPDIADNLVMDYSESV